MLTAAEARQLDRLTLGARVASPAGAASGLRHAAARGTGLEFQDYRHYQPGDEPRTIDWNVDARLGQLVVRVFQAEGRVQLHVLVDTSASMRVGQPDKLGCALKIAAALCYVAVGRRDACGLALFDEIVQARVAPAVGQPHLFRALGLLGSARAAGRSDFDRALQQYGAATRGPGLAVVLSDFFSPAGIITGLNYLLYRGLTPALVQVVAPEELRPVIDEEVELRDIEAPDEAPLFADADAVAAYRASVSNLCASLESFCVVRGLSWVQVESGSPFETTLHACVRSGLLASHG